MTAAAQSHRQATRRIRSAIVEALHASGGGHFGGALSVVDILDALYRGRTMERPGRAGDKLILSKGHAAIALYAVLNEVEGAGADLSEYASFGSLLQGHPDMLQNPFVHFSTGSLGQGIAVGLGMSMALQSASRHVWVVLGDGECQEGQIWEAAMLAARYRAWNLHAIVDCNGAQECGWSHDRGLEQQPLPDALQKWSAFGWSATEIDGHDAAALERWIANAAAARKGPPSVALARTRKGHGVRLFESSPVEYHCKTLSAAEIALAREDLGND